MTPLESLTADLDGNPPVAWASVDRGNFDTDDTAILGDDDFRLTFEARKFFPYQTSQGCNHHCRFCERDTRTTRRWHSPERVIADLDGIRRRFNNRYVFFTDDHIHKHRDRFVALLEALRDYGELRYYMAVRADEIDDELIDRMAEAGVCVMHCFPESGSDRIRRAMGKPIDMDRLVHNVERASSHGMVTYGSFVLGWPTETHEEAESSVELAANDCFDLVSFMPLLYFGAADVGKHLPELSIEPDSAAYFEMLGQPTEACLARYSSEEYRRFLGEERRLNASKLNAPARRERLRAIDIIVTPRPAVAEPPQLGNAPDPLIENLRDALPDAVTDPSYQLRAVSYDERRGVLALDLEHRDGTVCVYLTARSSQPHFAQTRLFNLAYRNKEISRTDQAAMRTLMVHLDNWRAQPCSEPDALLQRIPEPRMIMDDPEQARIYAEWDVEEPFRDFITHFQRVFPNEPVAGHVLDLGCGQGEVTFLFARAFPECRIDGIDAADLMLEQARRKAQGEPRLRFSCALLPNDAAPEPAYDCVISNSLLHHLAAPEDLWQAARHYARPGAPIFVQDLVRPASRQRATALVDSFGDGLHEVVRRDFFNSLLAAYTLDEVRAQLEAAGFADFTTERISDIQAITWGRTPP